MIPESDENARKTIQIVLQDDERLVWAGRPCLRLVLFSEVPLLILGLGLCGLCLSGMGWFHLDPLIGWKYQWSPESQQSGAIFTAVLALVCCFAWLFFSIWIAKEEGTYGITTKRALRVNRKRREIWVREVRWLGSVSIVSNHHGHGSVCIAGAHGSESMQFNYLDHVPTVATLVAETFGVPFNEVTSDPAVTTETVSRLEEILAYLYSPVGTRRGLLPAITSIGLWLAYLLVIWLWLGSIQGIVGHSWLLCGILVVFSVAITAGLVRQLKRTLKR